MIIREKTVLDRSHEMVKVTADAERNILSASCELHNDCAEELVADGSEWKNIWGANVYPKEMAIAFYPMISLRPKAGNQSMKIESDEVRKKIEAVARALLE